MLISRLSKIGPQNKAFNNIQFSGGPKIISHRVHSDVEIRKINMKFASNYHFYYSIVKDSSADLDVNFEIVQNRPPKQGFQ